MNGPKADGQPKIIINWKITCDTDDNCVENAEAVKQGMCGNYATVLENATLTYLPEAEFPML